MSHGPRSEKALEAAEPVAWHRGEVMFFEQRPGSCFDFLVSGPGGTSAIRVERALRLHGTPAEIALSFADTIARMSAAALAPGFFRELWLWAPWGALRYFRIEGQAINELDLLGNIRVPLVRGACNGARRSRYRKQRKKAAAAEPELAPASGESAAGTVPKVSGSPAPYAVREPAAVRFLRWRAEQKQRGKDGGGTGAAPPGGSSPGTHSPS